MFQLSTRSTPASETGFKKKKKKKVKQSGCIYLSSENINTNAVVNLLLLNVLLTVVLEQSLLFSCQNHKENQTGLGWIWRDGRKTRQKKIDLMNSVWVKLPDLHGVSPAKSVRLEDVSSLEGRLGLELWVRRLNDMTTSPQTVYCSVDLLPE